MCYNGQSYMFKHYGGSMKVIKFNINENYYNRFKEICETESITIKRKINVLLSRDITPTDTKSYFPEDAHLNPKPITLKINEELYKGLMKKCGLLGLRASHYVPYLIYKYFNEND
jgi:hypothetical protein